MPEARKPQDRKPKTGDDFTFRLNGKTLHLPSLNSLMTFGTVRKTRKLDQQEQMFYVIEENLDTATLAELDTMTEAETERFFTEWQEHSGITPGESEAS